MNTKVLLIDARPGPLGDIRSRLEEAGYRVVTAEDARSGLCAFERTEPGIVVVDSKLPGSPSIVLCRKLRSVERQKGSRVAIIMLTRGGGKKSRRTAAEAARLCDIVLRQPVSRSLLVSTMRRFAPPVTLRAEEVDLPAATPAPEVGAHDALEREIDLQLDHLINGDAGSPARAREEEALLEEVVDELLREGGTTRAVEERPGVQGTLDSLDLGEIVQMLALGGKTARVSLRTGADQGEVWFDSGVITHAENGDKIGEHAFFDMVSWRSGDFTIDHGLRCDHRSLSQDAMYLVMEGMRLMDEARRERPVLVAEAAAMELDQDERDREQTPDEAVDSRAVKGPDHRWISNTHPLALAAPRPGTRRPSVAATPVQPSVLWKSITVTVLLLVAVAAVWALVGA